MSVFPVIDALQNLNNLKNTLANPTGTPNVNTAKVTAPPANQIDPKLLNPFGLNMQPAYPSAAKSLTSPTGILGGNVGMYNGVNYGPTLAQATPQVAQPKTTGGGTTGGVSTGGGGGGSDLASMEMQLAQMRAAGKSMSNSKSYVSLYNKIKAAGGQTSGSVEELSGGGGGTGAADTAKNYITDLTNQYKQAIAGLTPLPQVYQGIESTLGIPELQKSANILSSTIANLPQTSLARAQRYDLSTPQMQEYQAGEAGRLSPMASSTYGALTGAQQEAANQLANVQTQYQTLLSPYQMAANLAPEYTNILSNIQAQNAQQQLQGQKAQQDLGYLQQQYALAGAQPITIGDKLIDPQTGRVIGTYPSTSSTAAGPSPTLSTTAGGTPVNLSSIWG